MRFPPLGGRKEANSGGPEYSSTEQETGPEQPVGVDRPRLALTPIELKARFGELKGVTPKCLRVSESRAAMIDIAATDPPATAPTCTATPSNLRGHQDRERVTRDSSHTTLGSS